MQLIWNRHKFWIIFKILTLHMYICLLKKKKIANKNGTFRFMRHRNTVKSELKRCWYLKSPCNLPSFILTEEIMIFFSNYFSVKIKERKKRLAACLKLEEVTWSNFSNCSPPWMPHFPKPTLNYWPTCNMLTELQCNSTSPWRERGKKNKKTWI